MTSTTKSLSSPKQEKICCIIIGSAGCGKSTLVENMSSDGISRSGNSENSVTSSIAVTQHKSISDLLLMDTVGCQDTGRKKSDESILKDITDHLGKNNAPKIKVIWCVKPEDRKIPQLQDQAKFIDALVNKNWGTVQIIVKKGGVEDDSRGATASARSYTKIKLPVYYLHCLDKIKNVKTNIMYKRILKESFDDRSRDGFIYSNEINSVILQKINKLKSAKANLKKEYYHKEHCKLKKKWKHRGNTESKYHHDGYTKPSRIDKGCPEGHTDLEYCYYQHASWVSNWECDKCGKNIKWRTNFYHCFSCCDRGKRKGHKSIVKKCAGMYCESCGTTEHESSSLKWTCCGNSKDSSGCSIDRTYWTCCTKNFGKRGCEIAYKYWDCCGTKENDKLEKECGKWKWVPKILE